MAGETIGVRHLRFDTDGADQLEALTTRLDGLLRLSNEIELKMEQTEAALEAEKEQQQAGNAGNDNDKTLLTGAPPCATDREGEQQAEHGKLTTGLDGTTISTTTSTEAGINALTKEMSCAPSGSPPHHHGMRLIYCIL